MNDASYYGHVEQAGAPLAIAYITPLDMVLVTISALDALYSVHPTAGLVVYKNTSTFGFATPSAVSMLHGYLAVGDMATKRVAFLDLALGVVVHVMSVNYTPTGIISCPTGTFVVISSDPKFNIYDCNRGFVQAIESGYLENQGVCGKNGVVATLVLRTITTIYPFFTGYFTATGNNGYLSSYGTLRGITVANNILYYTANNGYTYAHSIV